MNPQAELFPLLTEPDKLRRVRTDIEKRHKYDLDELDTVARHLAYSNIGNRHDEPLTVSINDVRDYMGIKTKNKHDRSNHYLGCLFSRKKYWIYTNREERSRADNSHCRKVKIWKLNTVLWNKIKRERDEKAAAKSDNRMAS